MRYVTNADLGGRDLPGHIIPEAEGDLFHADWEPRALALTLAMGATGSWNIDASRSARDPASGVTLLACREIDPLI
jgi:nitrile hydratase